MGRPGQPGEAAATFMGNGQYWDTIIRTPEGWRSKRREFRKPVACQPAAAPAAGRGGRGQ